MSVTSKIIDALADAIKLHENLNSVIEDVQALNHELRRLQDRFIEDATDKERRITRLETYLEIAQNQARKIKSKD